MVGECFHTVFADGVEFGLFVRLFVLSLVCSALIEDKTPLVYFVKSFFESRHEDVKCFSLLELGGGVAF